MLTIRQPDGTLAQVPDWMMGEGAKAMTAHDTPRLSLACLRGLRLELDSCLKLTRGDSRHDGGEHAAPFAKPTADRFIRTPQSPNCTSKGGSDEAPPPRQPAPDGDGCAHIGDGDNLDLPHQPARGQSRIRRQSSAQIIGEIVDQRTPGLARPITRRLQSWRAITETFSPCRCKSKIMNKSPNFFITTAPLGGGHA